MQWRDVDPHLVERFKRVDWNDPESAVELLKTREAVRALTGQMRREFPRVASAMLDQRDDHMTDGLPEQVQRADGRGGGHGAHGRDRVQVAGRDGRRRRRHPHIVRQRLVLGNNSNRGCAARVKQGATLSKRKRTHRLSLSPPTGASRSPR